jgi:hypothetical protein
MSAVGGDGGNFRSSTLALKNPPKGQGKGGKKKKGGCC